MFQPHPELSEDMINLQLISLDIFITLIDLGFSDEDTIFAEKILEKFDLRINLV
jgi:hypothetical protein